MSQEEIYINGELLRLRRETRGWALSDLATRACMSVKQIRQLEEGGLNSFYSQAVKLTAAKKVGALLGVSAEEVFAEVSEAEVEAAAIDELPHHEESAVDDKTAAEVESKASLAEEKAADSTPVHAETEEIEKNEVAVDAPVKSKTSLWVITGLFAAALAVAAYMQPKDEPVAEPVPPLQVVPSEADAAASAAEVSASSASSASSSELVVPVASASAPRVSAPAAPVLAASAVKSVTVPSVAPTSSAASAVKAP
jgi:transcriptional regulator with XRE-family HTH domain